MLEHLRSLLAAKLDERSTKDAEVDALLATPADEKRNLNDDEASRLAELKSALAALDTDVEALRTQVTDEEERQQRKSDLEKLAKDITPDAKPEAERQFRVKSEEPTYRKGGQHSFFRDAYFGRDAVTADPGTIERLQRHGAEMRDVGTSGFGALVVPQYLPEMFAENLRAGRVTANLCNHLDLPPEGMTLNIPRGTTKTVVASQTAENFSVTEVDFDETTLAISVRTLGGMNDVSRQAIERGYNVDEIVFADLAADYASQLDTQVINGAGTSGTHTGILNWSNINSVTTGTATAISVVAKVAQAIATVAENRFLAPDVIIMHPRRWGWLTAQSDSNGRPYVVPEPYAPQNARGVINNQGYGFVGSLQGLPVYTDANVPTTISTSTITGATEDNIIVARSQDLLLWENGPAPRQFRFEEVLGHQLTIRLVVADDSAFTAGWYPKGVCVISGSGMTTPTYP